MHNLFYPNRAIAFFEAKHRKNSERSLFFKEFFLILSYYGFILLDLLILWSRFFTPNFQQIILLQMSFLIAMGLIDDDCYIRINSHMVGVPAAGTVVIFGINMILYHYVF